VAAVLLTLGSAFFFAVGHSLQKHAVWTRFGSDGSPSGLRWIAEMVRRPLWVAGFATVGLASALDLQAVSLGDLTLVKPLLGLQAAFAVAIGVGILGERVGRSEALAIGFLVGGGMLVAASSSPTRPEMNPAWSSTGIFAASVLGAAGLVLAHHVAPGRLRGEVAFGLATGLMFGVSDFMMKRATSLVVLGSGGFSVLDPESWLALLRTPEVAWIALANVGAFFGMQLAYVGGRVAVISPLASLSGTAFAVALGFTALGEPFTWTRATGIAVVWWATGLLVRSGPADTTNGPNTEGTMR
jgi:drug/metabolite transporter (DMT)-like permease